MNKIHVFHQLEAAQLIPSMEYLKSSIYDNDLEYSFHNIADLQADENAFLCNYADCNDQAIILHLALDTEIVMHRYISELLGQTEMQQLNPYDRVAELSDDKYMFYQLMLANEITQPYTQRVNKSQSKEEISAIITKILSNCPAGVVLKPVHGTEKIDFMHVDTLDIMDAALEHARKILIYDDLLLQEFIAADAEYRVLYFNDSLYSTSPLAREQVEQVRQIVEVIQPEIVAFDFLDQAGKLYALESNIRPAAMYRSKHFLARNVLKSSLKV